MAGLEYFEPKMISLKNHPELSEKWLQERIAENPAILGLGDLILKDTERIQPAGGRLDLLLQDPDSLRRYEVEIQLGKTDESHIIRTIEYWDIERRRYPQYEHCAVIVAEEITARFLNVIGLFNGSVPLVAIKLQTIQIENKIGLIFTTVLDEQPLGLVEDDEVQEPADRAYWEKKGSKKTVEMADQMLGLIHEFAADQQLNYNKHYIGLTQNGQPNNFARFNPQKSKLRFRVRLPKSPELDARLDESELDVGEYNSRGREYTIRLTHEDFEKHREFLGELLNDAFKLSR